MALKTVINRDKSKGCTQKLLAVRLYLSKLLRLEEADARKCAARIYRVALRLSVDVDEWQLFCEHEDWQHHRQKPQPRPESQKEALSFAIKFATALGTATNASWGRKFSDLLRDAWNRQLPSTEIKAHIKAIQETQRAKAAETRDKRRENAQKTVTLTPTQYSKPLLATAGDHRFKAQLRVTIQHGVKPVFEIAGLGKKALKSFGFVKPEKPKPAKKPTAAGR